jgi:hypothetical protein
MKSGLVENLVRFHITINLSTTSIAEHRGFTAEMQQWDLGIRAADEMMGVPALRSSLLDPLCIFSTLNMDPSFRQRSASSNLLQASMSTATASSLC